MNTQNTKVSNLTSNRSGREVSNQFEIRTETGVYFQSYSYIIVFIPKSGKTQLDEKYWKYSKTTSKHRSQFLGETTKETQVKIDSGEYELTDLN